MAPGTENTFMELAQMINHVMIREGNTCQILNYLDYSSRIIIIGICTCTHLKVPQNAILVNMEQCSVDSTWFTPQYLELLRTHTVWDYCYYNKRALKKKFNINGDVITYGYMKMYDVVPHAKEKDIDVLIYGSMHPRRISVIETLRNRGVNIVYRVDNLWAEERNQLLGRCKILLNIHFYASKILEMPRLSLCLNNGVFVVTEDCGDMEDYMHLSDCMIFCPHEKLVETVIEYLKKPIEREKIAKRGYDRFSKIVPNVPLFAAEKRSPCDRKIIDISYDNKMLKLAMAGCDQFSTAMLSKNYVLKPCVANYIYENTRNACFVDIGDQLGYFSLIAYLGGAKNIYAIGYGEKEILTLQTTIKLNNINNLEIFGNISKSIKYLSQIRSKYEKVIFYTKTPQCIDEIIKIATTIILEIDPEKIKSILDKFILAGFNFKLLFDMEEYGSENDNKNGLYISSNYFHNSPRNGTIVAFERY
jgi:hypothetical protein